MGVGLGDTEGEILGLRLGESETEGETLGLSLGDREVEGDKLGLMLGLIDSEIMGPISPPSVLIIKSSK